jgi:hypothetical protein
VQENVVTQVEITTDDLREIADTLETFASIDEGEYTDTRRLHELAAMLRAATTREP